MDQFARHRRAELSDPVTGETIGLAYTVLRLPEPVGLTRTAKPDRSGPASATSAA